MRIDTKAQTQKQAPHLLVVQLQQEQHTFGRQFHSDALAQGVVEMGEQGQHIREGEGEEGLVNVARPRVSQGLQHIPAGNTGDTGGNILNLSMLEGCS